MKILRVASREGALGVAQAHDLMQAIRGRDPEIVPELVSLPHYAAMKQALKNGKADLCVHSMEVLPLELEKEFPIVAVSRRREARDVLICSAGRKEPDLNKPLGAQGSSRVAQLARLYPGWPIAAIDGDIESVLERLDKGEFGAAVLSESDLVFLGRQDRIHLALSVMSESLIITPCGQGIVAVQGRAGERVTFLVGYHDVDSWDMALAERAFSVEFLKTPGVPAAVRAGVQGNKISIHGIMKDQNGKQWEGVMSGAREDAARLGTALAARIQLDAMDPEQRGRMRFRKK